ncbi:MAG TPA: DUF86 domain-containing protein [Armatimonadota bacterium]|nr:DUF86 domain-containing protein [Armatimonadota bacterium]
MRRAEVYLVEMVQAAQRIASYIEGMSRTDFLADHKTRAAVVREIEIIGEAARQIPEGLRASHPEVRWAELARLRNLYIHAYHAVDYTLVWRTATATIPRVAAAVGSIALPDNTVSDSADQ